MPNEERPQDFELIELLIREAAASTSAQQSSGVDESFKARFQSYIDQIPSYMHSVEKKGFFPHFFFGSFSTLLDTEIAEKLGIEKIYFSFDGPQTLKVAVIKKGEIKNKADAIDKVRLFVISEQGARFATHRFSYGELRDVLGTSDPGRFQPVFDNKSELKVKLVTIDKDKQGVFVADEKLDKDDAFQDKFKKIEKGLWSKPEDDIAKLANSEKEIVERYLKKVLGEISKVHSKYEDSLSYAKGAREAAHHGFVAGALNNFRYRHNLRVYLEQFAGRGYADIVLLARGRDRALDSIPVIIELKAATSEELKKLKKGEKVKENSITTPAVALEQAKDYAKGFQPNTMRVLTTSRDVLCVGLNLDSTEEFAMYLSPLGERKPAPPTIDKLLEETSKWNGEKDTTKKLNDIKGKIKSPLERIYYTFPGTGEKGGKYFSRFLLGQLLFADKIKRNDLKKYVFLYDEYPLNLEKRPKVESSSERPVTTFALIRESRKKEVFIFHIREGGRGDRSDKKVPMPTNLSEQSKITEVYISLHEGRKSDFFDIDEITRYDSLNKYKEGREFFNGELKDIPYPDGLKEAFDNALNSQHTPAAGQSLSVDKYNELLKKIGEGVFPFKTFINKEADFQGVLHGAFSYYSDLKLKEPSGALVLTEFQTGRGKRIDMLVHGIAGKGGNAKEYTPVGLELKGPRGEISADELKKEANKQITEEYERGVTYKTLTDGDEVKFIGVVFNKGADNADSLILTSRTSKEGFISAKAVHSSTHVLPQVENLHTLESATAEKDYQYWLQQHDIPDIARIKYGYGTNIDTLFEVVESPEHVANQLQRFQDDVATRGERRPLTLVVNLDNNHWVTSVIAYQDGQYNGYYADSQGNSIPDNIRQVLEQAQITVHDASVAQQTDSHNCGFWALENARDINAVLREDRSRGIPIDGIRNRLQVQGRGESYFVRVREDVSDRLNIDQQRIANLETILAETHQPVGQCSKERKKRNIGMACIDSRDEENITKEEKERRIKELFDTDEIRERTKNVEFYDQLFKVSEQILKGEAIDRNIEEAFIAKVKDINLDSINPEIRDVVKEIKEKISEKEANKSEKVKDILTRSGVAEKISEAAKGVGLTYRKFLDDGGREFQNIINKINSSPEAMSHLNRVGRISGWAMQGIMYKNLIGDTLSGNLEGVAINLGFIGSSNVLGKIANTAAIKGEQFISEGKLFLGKSLKMASPFLARATSAFIAYDLANQVKALKSGDKDAMAGIVGDSIALTIDAAAIGIEIAEVAGILSGVSSITGPIGAGVTAVVFIGTDIYLAVKTVEQEDKIIHLTGWEKFKEGWRAFLHMKPEEYIEELIEEKLANNHLVENAVGFLKQYTGIQRYIFSTAKLVDGKRIEVDLNNKVLLNEKRGNIKWSRARPDNPRDGGVFCLPNGDWESVPKGGAYLCENAIGLSYSTNRTGNYTLIDLGKGDDEVIGSQDSPNIFFVGDGKKKFTGGNKDDVFILVGDGLPNMNNSVRISGAHGNNMLDLARFGLGNGFGVYFSSGGRYNLSHLALQRFSAMESIQTILGREKEQDEVQCGGDLKYVDGRGGKDNNHPDKITIDHAADSGKLKIAVRPNTKIINRSRKGNFDYIAFHGKGMANIDINRQTDELWHNFLFNHTLSDLKNVKVQNLPGKDTSYPIKDVKFSFQQSPSGAFDIDIKNVANNASYILAEDKTEVKIGNEGSLYLLQDTNKSIDEIIRNYPATANRLNATVFAKFQDELVVIGHEKHEVMSNDPLHKSHLVGNSGKNMYVITPTQKEVSIYGVKESSIDTLDLRNTVKDMKDIQFSSLSVSQDKDDLLIKLEMERSPLKFPIRLKNGVQWYQKLHVVLNINMQLERNGNNWILSPLPLIFDENNKIIVITAKDIEEGNKLIVHKQAGHYTFLRLRDNLVIITDPSTGENNVCTILLSNFYREPKMETLSIKFNDITISIQEKMNEINSNKLLFCSSVLQVNEPFSIDVRELLNNHDCLKFDSGKIAFFRSNDNLLLLSDQGVSVVLNYYSHVHRQWNLPIELNNSIVEPEEFREKADNPSSFRYYLPGEEGLQIYHNQPTDKYQVGLVDLKNRSILDCDMKIVDKNLILSSNGDDWIYYPPFNISFAVNRTQYVKLHIEFKKPTTFGNNTIVKVENWEKIMFAFSDAIVFYPKCMLVACNQEDIIEEFNQEKNRVSGKNDRHRTAKLALGVSLGKIVGGNDLDSAFIHDLVELIFARIGSFTKSEGASYSIENVDSAIENNQAADRPSSRKLLAMDLTEKTARQDVLKDSLQNDEIDYTKGGATSGASKPSSGHHRSPIEGVASEEYSGSIASSATRVSSPINNVFNWAKNSIEGVSQVTTNAYLATNGIVVELLSLVNGLVGSASKANKKRSTVEDDDVEIMIVDDDGVETIDGETVRVNKVKEVYHALKNEEIGYNKEYATGGASKPSLRIIAQVKESTANAYTAAKRILNGASERFTLKFFSNESVEKLNERTIKEREAKRVDNICERIKATDFDQNIRSKGNIIKLIKERIKAVVDDANSDQYKDICRKEIAKFIKEEYGEKGDYGYNLRVHKFLESIEENFDYGFFDNIDANLEQAHEGQMPVKFKPKDGNTILEMRDHYLSQVDSNGTIMLLDVLIRKVTGQKYIFSVDQPVSLLEARGYALNITDRFEKAVKQAAKDSKISMHRLDIDFMKVQEEVARKIVGGKFNEIPEILRSYAEKACPGREAGCPGRLRQKKFDEFNNRLDVVINELMTQIIYDRNVIPNRNRKIREKLKSAASQKARTAENVGFSKYVKGAHINSKKTELKDQGISNKDDNLVQVDVPGDGSCLFWSVALAYLVPSSKNRNEFCNRCKLLFGEESSKDWEKLRKLILSRGFCEDLCVQKSISYGKNTLKSFINKFRGKVANYISSDQELKGSVDISNIGCLFENQPTQEKIIYEKLKGSGKFRFEGENLTEIVGKFYEAKENGNISEAKENEVNDTISEVYVECVCDDQFWGSELEIKAITRMLSADISTTQGGIRTSHSDRKYNTTIELFHVHNNHYQFGLKRDIFQSIAQTLGGRTDLSPNKQSGTSNSSTGKENILPHGRPKITEKHSPNKRNHGHRVDNYPLALQQAEFHKGLNVTQLVQLSPEPQSYLSNISVQGGLFTHARDQGRALIS